MRFTYNINQDAIDKLDNSGLTDRIIELIKNDSGFSRYGVMRAEKEDELELYSEEIDIRGFLKDDIDFAQGFFNQSYSRTEKYSDYFNRLKDSISNNWTIHHHNNRVVKEEFDIGSDSPLMSGYFALMFLKPDEFWSPEKFGFDNVGDFWGCIGAMMHEKSEIGSGRKPHIWNSTFEDRTFNTEITGSDHGDLRIFRTETTPYKTFDPMGNNVSYRPEVPADRQVVAGYHSGEQSLLVGILRWADQIGIKLDAFEKSEEFLEPFIEQKKCLGPFGDAGYDSGFGLTMSFADCGFPLPILDDDNKVSTKGIPICIGTASNTSYYAFIDKEDNLIFSHSDEHYTKNEQQSTNLKLPPQEANEFVFGLFEQCRNGLGRTSFKQMADVLEYSQTDKYIERRDENVEMVKDCLDNLC